MVIAVKIPAKLKGMTILENMVAFVIIVGVLALAFVGLSVSSNYVQRGRNITDSSAAAQTIMERVTAELEAAAADKDKSVSDLIIGETALIAHNAEITAYGSDTVELKAGRLEIAGEKMDGIYVTVKIPVEDTDPQRFVTYCEFVPVKKA